MNATQLKETFLKLLPPVDYASARLESIYAQNVMLRGGQFMPLQDYDDRGLMITVMDKGGYGYGATSDLSEAGIQGAIQQALSWAHVSKSAYVLDYSSVPMPAEVSTYKTAVQQAWGEVPLQDKMNYLRELHGSLEGSDIVDSQISLWHRQIDKTIITSHGGEQNSSQSMVLPLLSVSVAAGTESQTRTFGGHAYTKQGGYEVFADMQFNKAAVEKTLAEARELLKAPECPEQVSDLIIAPDQMILQIHESIGHPLELDRILGDERNYAGTSFVTLDMFGQYQYGSDLLNITFDPTIEDEVATYPVDDDGMRAKKEYIIRNGLLERPLGGGISLHRIDGSLGGVANSRATSWNRPPIDRMANLNLEPGTTSFEDMVAQVENGVYVETNCSWSIDDSRNKFQFGCERAQVIKNGQLSHVVKNSGYRGVSASFWRNLKAVGREDTKEIMGTPYCGKGEPNQAIHVGHASPVCLFADVEVFGGGA